MQFQSCPYESPQFRECLIIYGTFIVWKQVFAIHAVFKLPMELHQPSSFRRHIRDKYLWFSEMCLKVFDKDLQNNLDISDENDFSLVENCRS